MLTGTVPIGHRLKPLEHQAALCLILELKLYDIYPLRTKKEQKITERQQHMFVARSYIVS